MPDRYEAEIVKAVGEATQCRTCANFLGIEESKVPTCKAFEQGIPAEIWVGNHKHTVNYPGDHGLKYIPLTAVRQDSTDQTGLLFAGAAPSFVSLVTA